MDIVIVHLIDGTYELYRQYYGNLRHTTKKGAAVDGVLASTRKLIDEGTGPVGVATDHVIESFRNELFDGYKTSQGMEPEILEQIPMLEKKLQDIGVTVWPMVDFEADDAIASAARIATGDPRVHQVRIYSPDKDLSQCISGRRVVQVDRQRTIVVDESAATEKYGVMPSSIPDYLALVGDASDGYPGIAGWGAKSSRVLLAKYGKVDAIPLDIRKWEEDGVRIRGAGALAESLVNSQRELSVFVSLATLVTSLHCPINDQ